MGMHITVDYDLCASTGNCMRECPEAFEVREDGYLYLLLEKPPESLRQKVERAVNSCPNNAISLEET